MRSLSGLGITLCFVFSFLFFVLFAELYYLLCWKKPRSDSSSSSAAAAKITDDGESGRNSGVEFTDNFLCFRRKPPSSSTAVLPEEAKASDGEEASIEAELIRLQSLHNLPNFPRLLFTIKEETKEEMDSDGGGSRRGSVTLRDMLFLATPPPTSPPNGYRHNPLFEARAPPPLSPPPKLKFLRDAEEKLFRRTLVEEALKVQKRPPAVKDSGPFVKIVIDRSPMPSPVRD